MTTMTELQEKLPMFAQPSSQQDLLKYLEDREKPPRLFYPQLFIKILQATTLWHQEHQNASALNYNVGPGKNAWCCVHSDDQLSLSRPLAHRTKQRDFHDAQVALTLGDLKQISQTWPLRYCGFNQLCGDLVVLSYG